MLILGPYITPAAAIVDYTFTLSCPRRLTADTAIDSITHVVMTTYFFLIFVETNHRKLY